KTIGHFPKPFAIDLRQQMMRHLFLVENPHSVRHRSGQLCDNFSPIGFTSRNHLLGTRMSSVGSLQVVSVERLIYDKRIRSVSPGAHHGGRDIARSRPHRDPDNAPWHGSELPIPALKLPVWIRAKAALITGLMAFPFRFLLCASVFLVSFTMRASDGPKTIPPPANVVLDGVQTLPIA